MIDNEIVKAWNEEIHLANYVDESYRNGINISLIKNTLDLINRLQADKEALIAGQETLQKALAEKIEEVEQYKADKEEYIKDYAELENEVKFLKADRDFERQRAYYQLQKNEFDGR